MSTYYFTFGSGHHDTKGRSLLGWYTTIEAESEHAARKLFFDKFGPKFATSYDKKGFAGQIEKYRLQHEPFEFLDLCCQVPQDQYLNLQRGRATDV